MCHLEWTENAFFADTIRGHHKGLEGIWLRLEVSIDTGKASLRVCLYIGGEGGGSRELKAVENTIGIYASGIKKEL